VAAIAPNVLDRTFEAPAPNRKWIADFTYVWTAEGWLYVAAVVDLFSRRMIGWSMNTAMTAQLVTDALVMAIWRRGKPSALTHHSDRGSQYTSEQFQRLMADHGVVCSISRSGKVWDNAAMESFFSSIKTERTARKTHRTRDEAKADVFDYIECFYNPKRRHSTIGYMSYGVREVGGISLDGCHPNRVQASETISHWEITPLWAGSSTERSSASGHATRRTARDKGGCFMRFLLLGSPIQTH
jgi:transposase InsO family protein